jgi:hypothetical protein
MEGRVKVMSSTAKECRERMAECERLAALTDDPKIKHQCLDLARTWQEMAENLEKERRLCG